MDINDARSIAITIPTVSYQSKSLNKNITFKTRAISKILIIGSLNVTTLMSYSQSQQQISQEQQEQFKTIQQDSKEQLQQLLDRMGNQREKIRSRRFR